MNHLFLSPHFDDAIGSCGGMIWRLVNKGFPVQVLTVFGGMDQIPLSPLAQVLHKRWGVKDAVRCRRLEDAAAACALKCQHSYLQFRDAVYRQDPDGQHLYPTFDSLRGPIAPNDRLLPDLVAAQVIEHVPENSIVYCPLGNGAHVDHMVTRSCGRILEQHGLHSVYYKDFYYDQPLDPRLDGSPADHVEIVLTEAELGQKILAFSEYASQIDDLFGGEAAMRKYFTEVGRREHFCLRQKEDMIQLEFL